MLAKNKFNSIESSISQALDDMEILNVLKIYYNFE